MSDSLTAVFVRKIKYKIRKERGGKQILYNIQLNKKKFFSLFGNSYRRTNIKYDEKRMEYLRNNHNSRIIIIV